MLAKPPGEFMIDLYTWTTPNGRKVSIMLEELRADYAVHPVNLDQGEQKTAKFEAISPYGKIPAIIDRVNDLRLMESGEILMYLAEKYGRFLPKEGEARYRTIEWLMWQMGGVGPMLGQAHHFLHYNPGKAPYAEDRFSIEAERIYRVLETRLQGRDFIVGDYSIADIACWPWVSRYQRHQIDLADYPNVREWYQRIATRPAVQRGYDVPKKVEEIPPG